MTEFSNKGKKGRRKLKKNLLAFLIKICIIKKIRKIYGIYLKN
jgi:hypothetical protein